jgi:hypothetical protein
MKFETQDDIHALLINYLAGKGFLSEKQAASGWHPDVEKIYKDYAHHGLGVPHPVMVPHDASLIPQVILEDAGLVGQFAKPGVAAASTMHSSEEQNSTPAEDVIKEDDNGDLSFMLQTGLNQPKVPTEGEKLADVVKTGTEEVASELESGDVVTKESLETEKKVDEEAESDEAPASDVTIDSDDDLDSIDA